MEHVANLGEPWESGGAGGGGKSQQSPDHVAGRVGVGVGAEAESHKQVFTSLKFTIMK